MRGEEGRGREVRGGTGPAPTCGPYMPNLLDIPADPTAGPRRGHDVALGPAPPKGEQWEGQKFTYSKQLYKVLEKNQPEYDAVREGDPNGELPMQLQKELMQIYKKLHGLGVLNVFLIDANGKTGEPAKKVDLTEEQISRNAELRRIEKVPDPSAWLSRMTTLGQLMGLTCPETDTGGQSWSAWSDDRRPSASTVYTGGQLERPTNSVGSGSPYKCARMVCRDKCVGLRRPVVPSANRLLGKGRGRGRERKREEDR